MLRWLCLALGGLSFLTHASGALSLTELQGNADLFLKAESALQQNDWTTYQRLLPSLKKYPLYPYLIYRAFQKALPTAPDLAALSQELKAFRRAFPDFPFHDSLKQAWLLQAASRGAWTLFTQEYTPFDTDLACRYHYAHYHLSQDHKQLAPAKTFWLVGHSQPKACDPLFLAWKTKGHLTTELLWQRFLLALQAENFTLARTLSGQLPKTASKTLSQWQALLKQPARLKEILQDIPERLRAALATAVLTQWAKSDANQAKHWWQSHHAQYAFSNTQKKAITQAIGMYLAHQSPLEAQEWLAQLSPEMHNTTLLEWRIRLALRREDWPSVQKAITQLPRTLQAQPCWRYWHARALSALGQKDAALTLYQNLTHTRNYYGLLAHQHLQKPIVFPMYSYKPSEKALKALEARPAIQRIECLQQLHRSRAVYTEWLYALKSMTETERLTAAYYAYHRHAFDLGILSLKQTQHPHDLPIRFPLAFQSDVLAQAHHYNLPSAWLFAIIRQESTFTPFARSPQGARGLMQILPSTAQAFSKQFALSSFNDKALYQPAWNIRIGAYYLHALQRHFNQHLLLSTAAYNAGPTRVARWLENAPKDASIWIETLPFQETREYLKNIIYATCLYSQRLKEPLSPAAFLHPLS